MGEFRKTKVIHRRLLWQTPQKDGRPPGLVHGPRGGSGQPIGELDQMSGSPSTTNHLVVSRLI